MHVHLRNVALHSPPESVHALKLDALRRPEITFWSVWKDSELMGCGALKALDAAGWRMQPDGTRRKNGRALALDFVATTESKTTGRFGLFVQQDLGKLGVRVDLKSYGYNQIWAAKADPERPAMMMAVSSTPSSRSVVMPSKFTMKMSAPNWRS